MPVCLECGDKIRYGRKDKKFCCDDCRNRHYNAKLKQGRTYRRKVLALLDRNYELLDDILKSGRDSADFTCLMTLGFNPDAVTFCHHSRRHDIYGCFDITYKMSEWRIYSISKIQNVSLPLRPSEQFKTDHAKATFASLPGSFADGLGFLHFKTLKNSKQVAA